MHLFLTQEYCHFSRQWFLKLRTLSEVLFLFKAKTLKTWKMANYFCSLSAFINFFTAHFNKIFKPPDFINYFINLFINSAPTQAAASKVEADTTNTWKSLSERLGLHHWGWVQIAGIALRWTQNTEAFRSYLKKKHFLKIKQALQICKEKYRKIIFESLNPSSVKLILPPHPPSQITFPKWLVRHWWN